MQVPSGADFTPGDIVGKTYQIIGYIGRGAMGFVYHAKHVGLPKEYALKTLRSDQITDTAWFRFQMEAQSVAKMFHPNIVGIHNFGTHQAANGLQQPFYVMDLLQGASLMEKLRDHDSPPLPQTLKIFIQAASGFGYAHSKGIIHRDVKPGNIMLLDRPDATGASVKIVDFGIAKLTADADLSSQHLTRDGEIFGSPYYMSPEQSLGHATDSRSDIYSLGISLFETLTGEPPFTAASPVEIMLMHQGTALPDVNKMVEGRQYPPAVQIVLEQMTAKNPGERYQTMEQVGADLLTILQGGAIVPLPIVPLSGAGVKAGYGANPHPERSTFGEGLKDTLDPSSLRAFKPAERLKEDGAEEELNQQSDRGENDELGVGEDFASSPQDQLDDELDEDELDDDELEDELDDEQEAAEAEEIMHSGRAIAKIPVITEEKKLPRAQLIFLVISLAAAAVSGLIFFISRSPHTVHSHASHPIRVLPATITSTKSKEKTSKLDPEEDKEPGKSRSDTEPYCMVKTVKGHKVRMFNFPTDVLIGSIYSWNDETGKEKTVKAKGHLEFNEDDWLMYLPSRVMVKYPQYLKRFRAGDLDAFRLVDGSDSDALLAACTVLPGIAEVKFYDAKHLTNKCVESLNAFQKMTLFDGSNSTVGGAALARANCWQNIKQFYFSHGTEISPILERLKESKNLELLDLHDSPLSYQDFKTISTLRALHLLNIEDTGLTKNGLLQLAKSKSISELVLIECGLDESWLPVLRQFKTLKTLYFETTKTPIKLRDKFIAGLPGVKIK